MREKYRVEEGIDYAIIYKCEELHILCTETFRATVVKVFAQYGFVEGTVSTYPALPEKGKTMRVKDTGKHLYEVAFRESNTCNTLGTIHILARGMKEAISGAKEVMEEKTGVAGVVTSVTRVLPNTDQTVYEDAAED